MEDIKALKLFFLYLNMYVLKGEAFLKTVPHN